MSERARVLLVDDDADLVEIHRAALERAGYQVEVAYDGQEGLAKARAYPPRVIVLDVIMAEIDEGFSVVASLKADSRTRDVPIILLTSINRLLRPIPFGPDPDWLPVHAFLDKPISPDRLVAEVKRVLAGGETSSEV